MITCTLYTMSLVELSVLCVTVSDRVPGGKAGQASAQAALSPRTSESLDVPPPSTTSRLSLLLRSVLVVFEIRYIEVVQKMLKVVCF